MTHKGIIVNLSYVPTNMWKDLEVSISIYIDDNLNNTHFLPYSKSYSGKLLIFPYIKIEYNVLKDILNKYKPISDKVKIYTYKYDDYTKDVLIDVVNSNRKHLLKATDVLDIEQVKANDIQGIISGISNYVEYDLMMK